MRLNHRSEMGLSPSCAGFLVSHHLYNYLELYFQYPLDHDNV